MSIAPNKIILYIAASSDGYIADANGGVDWLPGPNGNIEDEFGYQALLDRIEIIVMGSHSYEQILTFGYWAWPDKQCYIFTSKAPTTSPDKIEFVQGDVKAFTDALKGKLPGGNIWLLGGAKFISSFAKAKLIDECIITVIPKTLGNGIKLESPYEDFTLQKTIKGSGDIDQQFYTKIDKN